jgi:hypothetical protein
MSQNPFSNPYDLPEAVVPERTSVLAVLSLILGIVCVPFFGIIAVFFGVMALFGIKASRGRVSGTGLAVTGIVLGIVFSLLWGGCVGMVGFGGNMMIKQVAPAVGTIITSAQAGDIDAVKSGLSSSSASRVTPEGLEAFRSAVESELGAYKGAPDSLGELIEQWGELFGAMGSSGNSNPMGNYSNAMPIPFEFEKGWALVIVPVDQTAGPSSAGVIPVQNVIILTPSGGEIVLVPYGTTLPAPTPVPPADPTLPPPEAPDASPDNEPGTESGGGG